MKNKEPGKTKATGYQMGARKTLPINHDQAWEFLFSEPVIQHWFGKTDKGALEADKDLWSESGITIRITTLIPGSHLRMKWKRPEWDNFSTLQIRIIANKGKTTFSFHQENLLSSKQRKEMKEHWHSVIRIMEKLVI